MARAHHRTASTSGPDALDWYDAAKAVEDEFLCNVALTCVPGHAGVHNIVCRAWREINGVRMGLAMEQIPFPNTKMQSFWGSSYLLLHRVSETLHNAAYTPTSKHPRRHQAD